MTDEKVFAAHAKGYLLCYNERCNRHEHCLRWLVKDYAPKDVPLISIVNPNHKTHTGATCRYFRSDTRKRMAVGMTTFFDEMPRKMEQKIRHELMQHLGRTTFFIYRRGDRPITPSVQRQIEEICVRNGWKNMPVYDGFTEEYEW